MEFIVKTIEKDAKFLRQRSREVDFCDTGYLKDIRKLECFCSKHECFAFAAIQIGIPKRIVYLKNTTLNISTENNDYNESKILINPVIISRKGKTQYWEACGSCLDYIGLVNRPYQIIVVYSDENGTPIEKNSKDLKQPSFLMN